ncbi:hypothetical protein ACFYZT_17580 [Streptomyces sp. NPDC001591]|uniref:hypothetical protein n=1 Tax=Streptomyces sp. NPDC001591 TaxID=3364589 RepID=UPI0036A3D804
MAFSAAELHVLRRSLAHALQSSTAPLTASEVQDCLRLAASVDEAVQEAGRLRTFLLDDLGRYRRALPGSLSGYLELLQQALAAGYEPDPDDLCALRALRANPAAAAVLERAQGIAERSVRRRLAAAGPAPRTRLLALAGGREQPRAAAPGPEASRPDTPGEEPGPGIPHEGGRPGTPRPERPRTEAAPKEPGPKEPGPKEPAPKEPGPKEPGPKRPAPTEPARPGRPVPTPGEVFPPRRDPAPPPAAGRAAV